MPHAPPVAELLSLFDVNQFLSVAINLFDFNGPSPHCGHKQMVLEWVKVREKVLEICKYL